MGQPGCIASLKISSQTVAHIIKLMSMARLWCVSSARMISQNAERKYNSIVDDPTYLSLILFTLSLHILTTSLGNSFFLLHYQTSYNLQKVVITVLHTKQPTYLSAPLYIWIKYRVCSPLSVFWVISLLCSSFRTMTLQFSWCKCMFAIVTKDRCPFCPTLLC